MSRTERCPECKKAVKGLYENNIRRNPTTPWTLRAFYCPICDLVLSKDQVVLEQKIYIKKEIEV